MHCPLIWALLQDQMLLSRFISNMQNSNCSAVQVPRHVLYPAMCGPAMQNAVHSHCSSLWEQQLCELQVHTAVVHSVVYKSVAPAVMWTVVVAPALVHIAVHNQSCTVQGPLHSVESTWHVYVIKGISIANKPQKISLK